MNKKNATLSTATVFTYPMDLNTIIPDKVWVINALKYLNLVYNFFKMGLHISCRELHLKQIIERSIISILWLFAYRKGGASWMRN